MSRITKTAMCRWLFAAAAVAGSLTALPAQQGNIRSVRFYTVKPERVGDFQAAVKDYVAVATRAGAGHPYSMFVSLTGPAAYLRGDVYTNWADLDSAGPDPKLKEQAAEVQRITTRITQCTESSRRIIDEVIPELSFGGMGAPPAMMRVLTTHVRPDKVGEYLELIRSEVLPAAKKAGLKVFSVAQTRYGGTSTAFVLVSGMSKWSDLDGGYGVEKAMGKEGYQRFLTKIRPLIVDSEYNVFRFAPELSYLPAPPGK